MLHPPVMAGGVVYAGSDEGRVYALDAETGRQLWLSYRQGALQASLLGEGRQSHCQYR